MKKYTYTIFKPKDCESLGVPEPVLKSALKFHKNDWNDLPNCGIICHNRLDTS